MITNDKGIRDLKHEIATEVCKLAWEDRLNEEEREKIVLSVSPGPKPEYRCCVYKEREIVRERIRLACGLNADVSGSTSNVVQVIRPACDGCPTSTYSVTDSCRFCLGRACINSCRFGAISRGENRMRIDPDKCRECGLCAKACPYGAIIHLERPCKKVCPVDAIHWDEYGFCVIDEEKCVHCGHCIHACPFGAIGSLIFLTQVIADIKAGKEVIAMCAPASEGQFGKDIGMASLRKALMEAGFAERLPADAEGIDGGVVLRQKELLAGLHSYELVGSVEMLEACLAELLADGLYSQEVHGRTVEELKKGCYTIHNETILLYYYLIWLSGEKAPTVRETTDGGANPWNKCINKTKP